MVRELRHDFRRYYGVAYDDVPTGEAIDLIDALPAGSAYVAMADPSRAWSEEREGLADVLDAVNTLVWYFTLNHEVHQRPTLATRPRDLVARRLASERSRRAREAVEGGKWEEM